MSESTDILRERAAGAGWRTPPEPITEDHIVRKLNADVVVIGAGHTGTCAVRAAAEEGASVICIDKQIDERQYVLGFEVGNINSKIGKARGVPQYDPLDFMREWQRRTLGRSNPELIRRFANNCGDTLDWFCEVLDPEIVDNMYIFMNTSPKHAKAELNVIHGFIGTAIFRGGGEQLELPAAVKQNQEYAKKLGAQFLFETEAQYLTKDGKRVTGVVCKAKDGHILVEANKGVLLACGDFSRNQEMVDELCPEVTDLLDGGNLMGAGWDGRGIQMGVWAGGRLEPRPLAMMGGARGGPGTLLGSTAGFPYFNRFGKRYVDEGSSFAGAEGARQPCGRFACIWDANWREQLERQGLDHGGLDMHMPEPVFKNIVAALEDAVSAGTEGGNFQSPIGPKSKVYAANTIEELAAYLGYEGDAKQTIVREVERYNELCALGRDEDFAKDSHLMSALDTPPFFGVTSESQKGSGGFALVTVGGLWINADQQVLDGELEPIAGLYASGNCSGRRFGFQYITPVGGVSIGLAHTMGRLAGRDIARL